MKKNSYEILQIHDSWVNYLDNWFINNSNNILGYLKQLENKNINYYPEKINIFKTFSKPLESINVIIMGQDPYSRKGFATGVPFAVKNEKWDTPTLETMRDELLEYTHRIDIDDPQVFDYTLENWRNQGVLLLNAAYTVQEFSPRSHIDLWKDFNKIVIKTLSNKKNKIFTMLGKDAQYFSNFIDLDNNDLIEVSHPARDRHSSKKYFVGSGVFKHIDRCLERNKINKINWLL